MDELSQIVPKSIEKQKKKKKSGGFQSMNLSPPMLRAIFYKGYKIPTPIQRKAIPVIMEGKNVVAMARTGSGKTAAFLIPMIEKLKCRTAIPGARALIFSPTRELAIQTFKFTKELSKTTDLKPILVLGGEKIEDQFAAIHMKPDIIIATPGRFLHVVLEMDLELSTVNYVVLDEADRLFEMGFQEQLLDVIKRLPSYRQTLLFSATLPKVLVEFVKCGVEDPVLIRLDVDTQISENLKTSYLLCRSDDKTAILLHLLKNVIDLQKELTIVFLATKHHVEYMKLVLEKASIPCSYIYSSLDQLARTTNIDNFRNKKITVMLVTDIAARGIDIPFLDNVINYNFPAKPKLFVHRIGRVARAGRSGKAFSFVAPDEIPYLLDLHLFLGKPIKLAKSDMQDEDGVCGTLPQSVLDDENDVLHNWHEMSLDLKSTLKVTKNGYKQYLKSRPAASNESTRRLRKMSFSTVDVHPMFKVDDVTLERNKMLADMKKYRPNTTIFELGPLANTQANAVMREKRKMHSKFVRHEVNDESQKNESLEETRNTLILADENDLKGFAQSVTIKNNESSNKKKNSNFKDPEHYLSYVSSQHYKEEGLGIECFERQAADAVLDFTADEDEMMKKMKSSKKWDRKKKRFVQEDDNKSKKMKTESGAWIPKSYKSDIYRKWKKMHKIERQERYNDDENQNSFKDVGGIPSRFKRWSKNQGPKEKSNRPPKREIKTTEEILKTRTRKEKIKSHVKRKSILKANRKKNKKR